MDNSTQRAALVLGLLGDDAAEKILARLKPEQAERLRLHREHKTASPGSRRLRTKVLEDFNRFLRFVEQQAGPSLSLYDEGESSTDENGWKRGGGKQGSGGQSISIDPNADPAEGLEQVTEFQVAGALEQESPRAVALLLSVLPPRRSADILAHLPVEQRNKVIPELGREQSSSPLVIERLMRTVLQRAVTVPPQGIERVDRVQRLADVLRAVHRPQRRQMMQTLEEHSQFFADGLLWRLRLTVCCSISNFIGNRRPNRLLVGSINKAASSDRSRAVIEEEGASSYTAHSVS